MRPKIPELVEALTGRFSDHHAFLTRIHLNLIDRHTEVIAALTARIEVAIEPYARFRDLISSIPGIGGTVADIVVAETGADMSQFPTAQQLTSWAGVAPGSNQSADVVKHARCRRGDSHLKAALGIAAMSAAKTKNTYLAARFARIKKRRGGKRAIVATQRSMLVSIWTMGTTGVSYHDLGADHYTRLRPERERRRALNTLQQLGYQVQLTKKAS
jgi:transposase